MKQVTKEKWPLVNRIKCRQINNNFFFSHSSIRPTTQDLLEQTFIAMLAFIINEIELFPSVILLGYDPPPPPTHTQLPPLRT